MREAKAVIFLFLAVLCAPRAGTAAVVSPNGAIGWDGKDQVIGKGEVGPVTRHYYNRLTDIQCGRAADPYEWVRTIE